MSVKRIIVLLVGLVLFLTLAVLDVVMARAANSIRPLVFLWLLVPAPLVFLALTLRTPSKALRVAGSSYLGISSALTVVVLLAVGWVGSERAIHPDPVKDEPKLSDYPALQAKAQDVQFKSQDGTILKGWFIPGERKTTILVLHGYGSRRQGMLRQANMLNRGGYTVFLFDFRNRGESGGDAVTLGYKEQGDVLGAIDYLKTRPDVDLNGFGAIGTSLGAASAILAAATSQDIKAVVADASFKSLNSVISQSFEHFIHLPPFPFAPLTVWFAEQRVGVKASQIAPEREVASISPRPIFVIHGDEDTTISPKDSEAIYAAARNPKQFWMIPGVAHSKGAEKVPEEYERRIVTFFNTSLK